MQMRTGDPAGRAHLADHFAGRHQVAFVHVDDREVREHREQSEAVVNHHGVSGKVQRTGDGDASALGA